MAEKMLRLNNRTKLTIFKNTQYYIKVVFKFIALAILFFIGLQIMISGFRLLGRDMVENIIVATSNPFISLFVGILITAIVQSSSLVTTMIVAIVASGAIGLDSAVFMVMGANIGTTVTSSIIAIGHVGSKKEFRKAIAAATVHDFFNILTAIILFPLEYYFGFLSYLAFSISTLFNFRTSEQSYFYSIGYFYIEDLQFPFFGESGILELVISLIILFITIRLMVTLFKKVLIGKDSNNLQNYLFTNPFKSLFLGLILTALVRSSSLMTSLIVPIVASNKLSVEKVFPFIMGANIGTTFTALIAALTTNQDALAIALSHLLFNIIGTLIFFPIPFMRNIPIYLARNLGKATLKSRFVGLAYITFVFFIIPFFLIFFSRDNIKLHKESDKETTTVKVDNIAE